MQNCILCKLSVTVVDQCKPLWLKVSAARGVRFVGLLSRQSHVELAVAVEGVHDH
jgi:hypothetical protein